MLIAATGEQVTIGLLAIALQQLGVKARSYTGAQVQVLTDSAFTKARILKIDEERIRKDLAEGTVVIVAGSPPGMPGSTNGLRVHHVGDAKNRVAPAYEELA